MWSKGKSNRFSARETAILRERDTGRGAVAVAMGVRVQRVLLLF